MLRDLGLSVFPITNGISLSPFKDTVNAKVILVKSFLKPLIGEVKILLAKIIRKNSPDSYHIRNVFFYNLLEPIKFLQ